MQPGEKFTYASWTPLSTKNGYMTGWFTFRNNQGKSSNQVYICHSFCYFIQIQIIFYIGIQFSYCFLFIAFKKTPSKLLLFSIINVKQLEGVFFFLQINDWLFQEGNLQISLFIGLFVLSLEDSQQILEGKHEQKWIQHSVEYVVHI